MYIFAGEEQSTQNLSSSEGRLRSATCDSFSALNQLVAAPGAEQVRLLAIEGV